MDSKIYSFLNHVYNSNQNKSIQFLDEEYVMFITKTKSFCHFDYCPNYSICFSSKDLINICLNTQAIFTIINQKFEYSYLPLSTTNSLIVTIKCEYLNRNSTLSSYKFNVKLDHFTKKPHFINNLSVNINGTVLILCSDVACFIFNTPYELSKYAESDVDGSNITITEHIKGTFLLKNIALSDYFYVVKASWSTVFSNTFVLVTNEYSTPLNLSTNKHVEMDCRSSEFMSYIRIYNLDKGLEQPIYELKLSERLCRLGNYDSSDVNYKFQKTRGKVVDIFMNSDDNSSLGPFTLFALSNYGYIFCYCPIILNSIYDFNTNASLIIKCFNLFKQGFKMKFVKQVGTKSNSSRDYLNNESDEIKLFISNVNNYVVRRQSELEFYPIVIRLLSNDFIPDCNLIYSYPVFESFIVLSTDPLIIVVSTSDSKVSLYMPKLLLYPSTSAFFDPSLLNALHICYYSQHIDFESNRMMSFKQLSQYDFLYYSMNAVYLFNYNGRLSYRPLFNSNKLSQCFYSYPVIIKTGIGPDNNNKINKYNIYETNDAYSEISKLNVSAIIIAHVFNITDSNKLDLTNSILMNMYTQADSFESSEKLNINYPSSFAISSNSHTSNEQSPIIVPNTQLIDKIRNAKTLVNGYKEIFKSLILSNDKLDFNEKAVEMMKGIQKLDSDVIKNIQSLPVFEKAVSEYVAMSKDSSDLIDEFFNDTIDHYHTIFNHVKSRIYKIKERRKLMSSRHSEIIKTLLLYNSVKNVDDTIDQVSNIISEFHLRYSNIILSKFDDHINSYSYFPTTVLNKQLEIDQWFYNTYKINVDLMHKIHSRIKTIRASMDTMI